MPKAKDSSVLGAENVTDPIEAEPTAPAEQSTEEPKGLSRREALEVAIEATKEVKSDETKTDSAPRSGKEVANRDARKGNKPAKEQPLAKEVPVPALPSLSAPAEWTTQEKADFDGSTRAQQEAALRLDRSRKTTLETIRREAGELQWSKDVVKQLEPFLKVRGGKEPTHTQIIKALEVVNQIDADPKSALAQILQAKGITVPKELLETDNGAPKAIAEKITPFQTRIDALENRLAFEENQKRGSVYSQAFDSLEKEKNAAGTPKFPDFNNTEAGIKLAGQIGSLVGGNSEVSKQFIATVKERIPGLDLPTLIKEAYKWHGGRVDESQSAKSQDTQQSHIARSSRAASSVPGGGAQSAGTGSQKKYKSYREAAAAALAELNGE